MIFSAVNVGLYRPATAISVRTAGGNSLQPLHANFSLDGNFQTCSLTAPHRRAWWQVDLLESYKIYAVEIVYRTAVSGKKIFIHFQFYHYSSINY